MRRFLLLLLLLHVLASFQIFLVVVNASPGVSYERNTALQTADQCDWTGSGGGGRGVRPVYLRCFRGTVFWRYPRGALRVVLSPPLLADSVRSKDIDGNSVPRSLGFRVCTKVSGSSRVYLEDSGKLRSVYSPRDGKHEASHRCFYAKKQPAAFYIEAEDPSADSPRDTRLQYDLELRLANFAGEPEFAKKLIRKQQETEEEEDCRPCSMEELARAYCQSDLVARGTVSAVQRRPDLEAAELVVGVTKTLRRVDENEQATNEVDFTSAHGGLNVRVRVPTACDARHGQGEFVIMAKRRLGDLVLVCAPRLETWAKAVRELESAPCVLKS